MAGARDRLAAARAALTAGFDSNAISAAYYAMLYAARAALSEEERYSKTHSGTWGLFRETFVVPGRFEPALYEDAHRTQQLREGTDYDAVIAPRAKAEQTVDLADRFVAAVAEVLDA